ncbi:MAG: PLP-dependent aminotransferase family protein [Clostridia bacterium]|nr:PLP-dependent aminotransferase family protein [Clostridia bacterium]
MLTYDLNARGKHSMYEQLYLHIKEDILSCRLTAGEKLPSKRKLAEHLQISVITVENAYAQLAAEGYITPLEKKGYFINQVAPQIARPPKTPFLSTEQPPSTAGYSAEGFPFALWCRMMRRVIAEQGEQLLAPLEFNGVYALRKAICTYLYDFRGIRVQAGQIIIGAGTEYLYNLLIQLLGRDKVYAVENPGHSKIYKIYTANGVECRPIPLDAQGLSVEQLRTTDASIVHISPAHHYPTGIVMPVARRQELLNWASEAKGYILEDEYDSEFRFVGRPIPTLFEMDAGNRVIYINTFSKTLAPSIRISYMVLPEPLMEQYKEKLRFYACTVPSLEQYTLAAFIRSGGFERHISRMKIRYRKKRDAVIRLMQEALNTPFRIQEKDAGLHFLVTLSASDGMHKLVSLAKERGIRVTPLSKFDIFERQEYAATAVVDYAGYHLETQADGTL